MLQKRVLVFIKAFNNNNGYSPSVRDIARGCDVKSTSTVKSILDKLEQGGYIERNGGKSRSIVVSGISKESGIYTVPLISHNKAEERIGMIDIPKSLVSRREGVFAVKCSVGLEEKSILAGDILIVRNCQTWENGELVVTEECVPLIFDGVTQRVLGKVLVCIRHF